MDLVIIVIIWVAFSIIGAIIKGASKKKNNTARTNINEDSRTIENYKRPSIDNPRDDDEKAISKLKNSRKKQKGSNKKVKKAVEEVRSSIDSSKYNDTDSDDVYQQDISLTNNNNNNFTSNFSDTSYKDYSSEIANIDQIGIRENKTYGSPKHVSSNMFEQAVIYEAIFNRKGKKVGSPRLAKKYSKN